MGWDKAWTSGAQRHRHLQKNGGDTDQEGCDGVGPEPATGLGLGEGVPVNQRPGRGSGEVAGAGLSPSPRADPAGTPVR